jgi:hypothetical protein
METLRSVQVEAQWLGVSPLRDRLWSDPRLTKYFRIRGHAGLARGFNMPANVQVVPHSLSPTDGMHRLISRDLTQASSIQASTPASATETPGLPYREVCLGETPGEISSVTAEIFPGVLVVRVKARLSIPFEDDGTSLLKSLAKLRSPRSIPAVDRAIRMVNLRVNSDTSNDLLGARYSEQYFGLRIELPYGSQEFEAVVPSWQPDLIACLIGTSDSRYLRPALIEKVSEASRTLNEKSPVESLLLNKQGFLYLVPQGPYRGPHTSRFTRTMDLATLAHFAYSFLANTEFAGQWPGFSDFIGRRVATWTEDSKLVFRSSTSNRLTWGACGVALSLSDAVAQWRRSHAIPQSASLPLSHSQAPEDWWALQDFQRAFEQSVPVEAILPTVSNVSVRDFILRDREESIRCRATGNYRASVVMAGAAAEGLLLGTLLETDKETAPEKLSSLGFQDLIKKCCPEYMGDPGNKGNHTRLISVETAVLLDNVARPWRNYVHAGLALRSAQEVGKPTADAAIAALDLLMGELRSVELPLVRD